ncbi:MAG: hypothetical protein ABFC90_06435 [Bacteroidales bacterium]|nr:hypothetical protein [Bacteroidales bacterium]
MRTLTAFLFFVLFCQSVLSDGSNLELRLLNEKKREVDAGLNMNVLIMFSNHSNTDKEFQIKINTLGDNWKLIADYSSIQIEKNSNTNKVVGIQIPNNFSAGDFSVELEAFENPGHQSFGKVYIPIYIRPRYELQIEKLKTPQYLFAGDTLGARFLIRNLSNLDIPVNITAINGQESKISHQSIPKDSSLLANVPISISKDITNYTQQSVILSAAITDKPETEKSIYYLYDVFPSKQVNFDGFNRFPVRVSSIIASGNRLGESAYSTMYDIYSKGFINEIKKQSLNFHLRGPNRSGNPLFGLNDEYYLTFRSPKVEVMLGDNNYSLSDLTESSRNGRGIKLQYTLKKWSVGSYYNSPRYYPTIKQVYSFYSNYEFNPKNSLSAGYLSKTDTTNNNVKLLTFSGSNSFFSWMNTDFELALGQKQSLLSKAYKGSIHLLYSPLSTHLSYTHADVNFPGFVSNTMRLSSGITANFKNFNLYLNYDINNSNLALDTLYSNAPLSKNLSFSTGIRISPNNSISLGVYSTSLKDRAPSPLFNYNKYNGRIALQNRFGPTTLNLQGELGKIENFLGNENGDLTSFYNGSMSMNYLLNKNISASGFVNYQGGQQYKITGFDRFYYGTSVVAHVKEKFSVSLHYNSNYELKDYSTDRSLLSLQVQSQFNPRHEISFDTNYNLVKNTLNTKEFSLQLRYTYMLNIPISKKKDIGSLTGKIINHGVEKVGGIRLNLNGIITITDKEGNFKFPMVKVGTYMLTTDESSFGLNAITEIQGPYWVTINPGKETHLELAMTKSASIEGKLVIQEDERSGQKGFYPIKEEIDKLIIEASNSKETYRVLSGRDGSFRFEDLRPGDWQVKVYTNGIPQGYLLVKDQFKLNLLPGQEEKLDVIIQKKIRQIKFQGKF